MFEFDSPNAEPHRVTTLAQLAQRGLLDIEIGARLNSAQSSGDGDCVPIVMPENMSAHGIDTAAIARLSPGTETGERFRLRANDIVFSRRGDLSRRVLIGSREAGWICGNGCLRVRVESAVIHPRFAFLQFAIPSVTAWLMARSVGSTLPHINKVVLQELPFFLPPLARQMEVADLFDMIDRKIALIADMSRTLLEGADTRLTELLRGVSLESAVFGELQNNVPSGYSVVPLSDCCLRIENGRTPVREDASLWDGPVPWLTSGEIRKGVIIAAERSLSREALPSTYLKNWPKGTTIIAMCGATAGQAGWLAIEATANQACCGLVPLPHLQAYIYRYLNRAGGVLRRLAKGTAQLNLNQRIIAQFPIVLPPRSALENYEHTVRPMLEKIAGNARESATLSALRESLYPELTRMPSRNSSPADALSKHA